MMNWRVTLKILAALALIASLLPLTPVQAAPTPDDPAAPNLPDEPCPLPHQDVSLPLNDLGAGTYTRMDGQITAYTGGLYPGGSNSMPAEHLAGGLAQMARIQPLDVSGNPDALNGKVVMVSIGMSNTSTEYLAFRDALDLQPRKNPALKLINGAQPSMTADQWIDPAAETWQNLLTRLGNQGLDETQVQVAWVKLVRMGGGNFPAVAQTLQADLLAVVHNLKFHFPNIRLVFFSSRTHSHNYWYGLSPEPQAFESAFAFKWLIEAQINGDPQLNYDPAKGAVTAPFLSWGPYLWANGPNPRADGLTWLAEDMVYDCTHPAQSGVAKVVDLLMGFFTHSPLARGWFLDETPGVRLYLPVTQTNG